MNGSLQSVRDQVLAFMATVAAFGNSRQQAPDFAGLSVRIERLGYVTPTEAHSTELLATYCRSVRVAAQAPAFGLSARQADVIVDHYGFGFGLGLYGVEAGSLKTGAFASMVSQHYRDLVRELGQRHALSVRELCLDRTAMVAQSQVMEAYRP